ncbi:MAG: multidrug ABC transporter ATP-binding protein [Epulopiscium sp. Nele67-Bin005]|nr:MAG: multidrug ABC transporter ATP-binding protein [Epulopiscium sp. Nele67-Bin005]
MIKFQNVTKTFGQDIVLKDVNFELEHGKTYGFVGRNGSGKTVIFKLIAGLILPTEGKIFYNDVDLRKSKKFPDNIGVLIETPGFIPHYTGVKNLQILNELSKTQISIDEIKNYMKLVGLDPDSKKQVRTYSLGMRQKLGIAQAVMNTPSLLILDEPMNGLDEASVLKMREFFTELKNQQVTILLASHNKDDIEVLCDKIFTLQSGVVIDEKSSV